MSHVSIFSIKRFRRHSIKFSGFSKMAPVPRHRWCHTYHSKLPQEEPRSHYQPWSFLGKPHFKVGLQSQLLTLHPLSYKVLPCHTWTPIHQPFFSTCSEHKYKAWTQIYPELHSIERIPPPGAYVCHRATTLPQPFEILCSRSVLVPSLNGEENHLRNSRIQMLIFTKIKLICPRHTAKLTTRFRLNLFIFFWDILLTDRQTNMGENITSIHLRWWR